MRTFPMKTGLNGCLLVLTLSSTACFGPTESEQSVAGVYALTQLDGQSLPAPYVTTCEFPGTSVPSRPSESSALSGSLDLRAKDRSFTLQVSIEVSCGPGHLIHNTPTAKGTWKIDGANTIRLSENEEDGSFWATGSSASRDVAVDGQRLTLRVYLGGASGAPVPVTLLFVR